MAFGVAASELGEQFTVGLCSNVRRITICSTCYVKSQYVQEKYFYKLFPYRDVVAERPCLIIGCDHNNKRIILL
jgi:hypothetical protein